MDHKEFDELVARITSAPSRRDALKGIFGGALASVGVEALADSGDAAKNKGRGDGKKGRGNRNKGRGDGNKGRGDNANAEGKKKNKKKKCKGGKKHCGNKKKCFNLQTSSKHCGNCGTRCATGQFCSNGICRSAT